MEVEEGFDEAVTTVKTAYISKIDCFYIWNEQLCHVGSLHLSMVRQIVTGVPRLLTNTDYECDYRDTAKSTQRPLLPVSETGACALQERVFSDVLGLV